MNSKKEFDLCLVNKKNTVFLEKYEKMKGNGKICAQIVHVVAI